MKSTHTSFSFRVILLLFLLAFSCKKETIKLTDNDPSSVNVIPQIRIENYVNRVFIDLLGREPLDTEMEEAVGQLKFAQLSTEARKELITMLQHDESFIEGDTSYLQAYHQNLYNMAKIRCLEGASDEALIDVAQGDDEEELRMQILLQARRDMQNKIITYHQLFARVIDNAAYDVINMNTFNFINASFDNLLFRFPTDAEFQAGFNMIEDNQTNSLFGENGQNKLDYIHILTSSREMSEGIIIWAYQRLLSRKPTTEETIALLEPFHSSKEITAVQLHIMSSDEYTNF